ncbi:MAG: response regulator [Myxococcota bacterium]
MTNHITDQTLTDLRVLIVDDDDSVRKMVARVLNRLGATVWTAPSAEHALNCASVWKVDVVLSDVMMPGATGHELAARLGALRPELPVVLMSGAVSRSTVTMSSHHRQRQLLSKPFSRDQLLSALRPCLPYPETSASSV